jgi:hypothetical protein
MAAHAAMWGWWGGLGPRARLKRGALERQILKSLKKGCAQAAGTLLTFIEHLRNIVSRYNLKHKRKSGQKPLSNYI